MTLPGPSAITNPTPHAAGVAVRKPRCQIWVDGRLLPIYLDVTITRGLDQAMATAEIAVPHPLPDYVKYWSRIQIAAGITPYDASIPQWGVVTRFTGFCTSFSYQLWPPARIIHCQDILVIASQTYTPEEIDLHGLTDQQAVQQILSGCGYNESTWHPGVPDTAGTGTILADIEEAQLFWELGETALAAIQKIDEVSLGYRTYATAGGAIVRQPINTDPNKATALWSYGEGVDILDGSLETEVIDPAQEITVSGFDGSATASTDPDADPFNWMNNSYWIRFLFLQTQARGMGTIDPQLIAQYTLSQVGQRILKVTFTTHLDLLFQAQEVVGVRSEKLEVDQQFWVQNVQLHCASDGSFTQTLTGISALQPQNRHIITPPVTTPEGTEPGSEVTTPTPTTPAAPTGADFLIDFTIVAIDRELAGDPTDTGDTGSAHYIVNCENTSTNAQTNQFNKGWEADGPGVTIASQASGPLGDTFSTAFTSLEGATITLTLTDGLSNTASLTKTIGDADPPVRSRKLYALTPATYEAYNGTAWVSQPPVLPSKVQSLGGGPIWGADHYVVTSADDLATAPTEVAALSPGEDVTAIWLHEVNPNLIAIGGANGSVAISTDYGATWTQKTALAGEVKGIIISIFREAEIHVVTPDGWYTSDDQGETWRLVRAGDFLYLELSHSRNIVVTSDGELQVAETGDVFIGNTSPIKAATSHIRRDQFYAIALDGTTWVQDTEGSLTLIAGEPIPDGDVLPGGAYRDGQVINMVFFAASLGGIFKTIDGFTTAEGYLRLRADGRLTP